MISGVMPQPRYCPLDDSLWILYIMEFDVDAKIIEKIFDTLRIL
jgi:hypothetical protein